MNNRNGALSFDAYIGDTDFNRTIQSMNRKLEGLTSKTVEESRKMESAFSNLGRLAAGGLAAAGLSQLPAQIVKVRGEFQQLEISFNTMLGSKAKADKLLSDVTKFAAQTPYGLKETASATKLLLAYGASADSAVETLRRLGDVAAGIGAPLGDIAYLYGTTMVQGRLYIQDLNQFLGRGIPLIGELAKILKVADGEVKGMVEAGKVGFPEVQKAFENLTKSGSMFGGLMEAQSKSLVGLQAQLGDAVDAMFNDIGRSQEGLLSETFKGAISVVENYKKVIDVLKVVVATYGAYRAAIMLTAAAQSASIILGEVQAFIALARSIKTAADAQALLNIAVRANPYVLAATALAGLVTAFIVFSDEASEAEKLQTHMNEAMKKAEDAAASEQAKIQVLTTQIKDETKSRDERNKKLQELISLSPQHLNALNLENFATAEGTKLIGGYIEAKKRQIELKEIEAELEKSITNQNKAKRGENDLSFWDRLALSSAASAGDLDYSKSSASERKRLNDQIVKDEDTVQAKLRERVKALSGVDAATTKSAENTSKAVRKTVADYNDEIKALKDKQEKVSSKTEYDAIGKQIKALEARRDAITGGSGKAKSAAQKAAKGEKDVRIKTFAEELDEKKRLYELYERWTLNYGKQAADEQFASLISQNKDYLAYVNAEIQRLETMRDVGYAGSLSNQDKFDLDSLISERTALTGGKSPIDQFREKLDAVRDSSESLTDELIKLKEIQEGLNPNDNSSTGVAQRRALVERELEAQKQRKELLRDFLLSVAGSEQKRLEITKHYADLRAELDSKILDKTSAGYKKMMASIDDKEKREIEAFGTEAITESKGYKELEKALALTKRNDTGRRIALLKQEISQLTVGTDEYIKKLQEVKDAEEDHGRKTLETWGAVAGMIGDIGSSLEGYGGTIGEIGGALSGLAVAATKVSSAFANMDSYKTTNGKMSMDGYVATAQNVIQIITGIIDAQKRRREAERQFEAERIGFENEYALQLNKSIGGNYKNNPFYRDYGGMIKAGVDQYKDAFDKYQDAIDKLEEGRVKQRQKNVVDGKTTLQMAGAGAAAGAIIGSVLPGVGTAIGAVVGGVVGAIGGLFAKKKKDVYSALLEQYPELVKETADGWAELNVEMANALITNNQVDDKTKELVQNAIELNKAMQEAKQQIEDTMIDLTGQIGDNLKNALVEAFRAGDSAAQALHKTVGDIIADITSKLLFSALVGPALDQLVKEMTQSLTTGDGAIVDDLVRFDQYGLPAVEKYFQGLEEFDKWAKEKGFDDVFGRSQGQDQAMQGVIKGVSEETVSVLIGQTNAIRIYQAQMAFDVRSSLLILTQISQNTSYNRYLVRLDDVVDRLERLNATSMRGFGL
ncbi:tape measure protein [Dyadobacter endophyticus]|uniref:tape measure protein n=1 Tax=Dyadobacter endophyticus TaxID=1749036 RepID=UPI003CE6A79D